MNREQLTRLAKLSAWLQEHSRRLLFELLEPAEPAQLDRVGGDRGIHQAATPRIG